MAVNPVNGPIIEKAASDPNGPPGTTSGNVQVRDATTSPRPVMEPTAGNPPGQPGNPHLNPLDEGFAPIPAPSAVGPA